MSPREYTDNNLSATARGAVRPEYQRLLEGIASGQIDAMVVYDLDRLTRRQIELERFASAATRARAVQPPSCFGDPPLHVPVSVFHGCIVSFCEEVTGPLGVAGAEAFDEHPPPPESGPSRKNLAAIRSLSSAASVK